MALPDITTLSTLGGAKTNYAPVEDSTTDISADEWNQVINNIAGLSYTGVRAWRRFVTANTSTPTDPASNSHGSVWGNGAGVKPTMAYVSTGKYTCTWTASQTDLLGTSHTLALFTGWGNAESSSGFYHVQVEMTAANVATITVRDAAGALVNSTGITIAIFVI